MRAKARILEQRSFNPHQAYSGHSPIYTQHGVADVLEMPVKAKTCAIDLPVAITYSDCVVLDLPGISCSHSQENNGSEDDGLEGESKQNVKA